MIINFETLNQVPLVDPITTPKDIETPIIKVDLEEAGAELEVPISSLDDLKNLLDSDDDSIFATIDADLEIAKNSHMLEIDAIANKLNINSKYIEQYFSKILKEQLSFFLHRTQFILSPVV